MSKRALIKYLSDLDKAELQEQLLDLYQRFPQVKKFYDFAFNPREDKLIREAQSKISNEYFPLKRKRPRARRSVAQKFIRQFNTLGMDPVMVADLMLYNLETAQRFESGKRVQLAFYKSMLNSFREVVQHIVLNNLLMEYKSRIVVVYQTARDRDWPLMDEFSRTLDMIE